MVPSEGYHRGLQAVITSRGLQAAHWVIPRGGYKRVTSEQGYKRGYIQGGLRYSIGVKAL